MMDTDWRPDNWEKIKAWPDESGLSAAFRKELDRLMEFAASSVLQAYLNSEQFAEDALEFYTKFGWTLVRTGQTTEDSNSIAEPKS